MSSGAVLGFELSWFDPVAGQLKKLFLKYFLDDNTIEILAGESTFLKRIFYPEVKFVDLFLGNSITIFNRLMVIKAYANAATTRYMESRETHILVVVGSLSTNLVGDIFSIAKTHKLNVSRVRTTYSNINHEDEISAFRGDIVIEFVGLTGLADGEAYTNSIQRLNSKYIRATIVSIDVATSVMAACTTGDVPDGSTLCLIKPHILKSQQVGDILSSIIESGFSIEALFAIHLSQQMADEMFDIYKTVLPNFTKTVEHMSSGTSLAVMITGVDTYEVVERFRELAGPFNPELAQVLRPSSLRARFGVNSILNGVHCTDIQGDGEMECRYIFSTLASL